MKILVIGIGIGRLYTTVLDQLGHQAITVDIDPHKQAQYTDLTKALHAHRLFDAVFICTPNHSHNDLAQRVASHSRVVFVEKPGVINAAEWQKLQNNYPETKFIMIKNNMWRVWGEEFYTSLSDADVIQINWINRDRVPSPGSWFTNKKLSFGGVSRDLMPHLLSMFITMNPLNYKEFQIEHRNKKQNWRLDQLTTTEYGSVNLTGVYDVDDRNEIILNNGKKKYMLTADWRSMIKDDIAIHCYQNHTLIKSFDLGLCPESAYATMINTVFDNINNQNFWRQHLEYDVWIHNMIDD